MVPMMVAALLATPRHESEAELTSLVTEFVRALTGEPTIMQTRRLADEVALRGGPPVDALDFKDDYVARLAAHTTARRQALLSGVVGADDLLVPGAREFLDLLRARRVTCFLASGTDEPMVREECALLGLAPYFAGMFGARPDETRPIKQLLVEQVVRDYQLSPGEWAAFGDGVAEIKYARQAGGLAVGVATDEDTRRGVNAWKRERLIGAGAQLIIPDFRQSAALAACLFSET